MQGVVGSIPWTALMFLTLYMQLIGMSDSHAGMLVSMSLGAYGAVNLIGGGVGTPQHPDSQTMAALLLPKMPKSSGFPCPG